MSFIDNYTPEKEFKSTRNCAFCNSKEGKTRMVGNYIVKLSYIKSEGIEKLACQGCRIKKRNQASKAENRTSPSSKKSFLKSLFRIGY